MPTSPPPRPTTDPRGATVAVVPIRSLREGKTRLAGALSPDARADLIRRMLAGVVGAASASGVLGAIVVVSPDPDALAYAAALSPLVVPLRQPAERPGLIPALDQAREWAEGRGAAAMLILFGDLPLITPVEVRNLVRRDAAIVLAPDRHGTGTNAMLLRLDAADDGPDHADGESASTFRFRFGTDSYAGHRSEAERLGWDVATAIMSGTALDLDTPADLDEMAERAATQATVLAAD